MSKSNTTDERGVLVLVPELPGLPRCRRAGGLRC